MAHFGGSLASSVGNVGPYEIYEIPTVLLVFQGLGGIGRHPGSIWNHLGGIWRQLGGIWRFLGGIWRLLGGRGAGLGDPRILSSKISGGVLRGLGALIQYPVLLIQDTGYAIQDTGY